MGDSIETNRLALCIQAQLKDLKRGLEQSLKDCDIAADAAGEGSVVHPELGIDRAGMILKCAEEVA